MNLRDIQSKINAVTARLEQVKKSELFNEVERAAKVEAYNIELKELQAMLNTKFN